ncbi:RNA-binding cell elongation regulator Jag/EloR [Hathewaya massiliensis]|uniref:RNA-binding cell elongation regulator Jag/EloR n=1 Tax=Hathewaya massiliensis TaxID=1964382 RepID=UPI00115C4095|nr:RNA-binding cell elongation regulator Jag/EloR [Hathewaya massiliensis]
MKSIETSGKTVEEAVKKAVLQLGTTENKVEIEVLEKGSKGFLNLIGTKLAKVKVTVKKDFEGEARQFLNEVLNAMNIEAEIHIEETKNTLNINLQGKEMGLLIGYRGETLDSLQYLVSLAINKGMDEGYKRVVLDTEGYRKKREETLIKLADKLARKVKNYRKTVKLEPMNPYERRIIHSALQDNSYVRTYSEGDEPFRRVVIEVKNKA